MTEDTVSPPSWTQRVQRTWGEPQNRNAWMLLGNQALGAATGVIFWILFTRFGNLPPSTIGIEYSIVTMATIIALLAKGGLDTALLRHVPKVGAGEGRRLLRLSAGVAAATALALAGLGALAAARGYGPTDLDPMGWLVAATLATFLVVGWLQDAHSLAESDARWTLARNGVLAANRLLLPLMALAIAVPHPVSLAWALALAASTVAGIVFLRYMGHRDGPRAARRAYFATALRNVPTGAAEFLPGLLLPLVVLVTAGPEAAAYFGIAWTSAALLFLASAALARSALASMSWGGTDSIAASIQRATRQHLAIIVPLALVVLLAAPQGLTLFGAAYAQNGTTPLRILVLSLLFVAPTYLYVAVLRTQDRAIALAAFPLLLAGALLVLTPLFTQRWGVSGVAFAWLVANAPFGVFATWKLAHLGRGVMPDGHARSLRGASHVE